jgi:hypothetical protein
MRKNKESGQSIILVVLAVGLCLMGALGLAVDTGQLYGHRQMAQAAADAAAEAAILSIYGGSNTGTNAFGSSTLTCANGTDGHTPCVYARQNGFGATTSADTVTIDFPTSVTGVTLSPGFSPAAVHVLITRPVQTTFLRLVGAGANKNVKAAATAAIMRVTSPIPIVVLHRTLSGSFSASGGGGGTPNIKICGGPQQSIQVNSKDAAAVSVGGSQAIDLSKGGPLDTGGNCTAGTGTDFGVFGGPTTATPTTYPSWMTPTGSTTHYYSHHPWIPDPLAGVNAPDPVALGLTNQTPITTGAGTTPGTGDCPSTASGCTIYHPGIYTSGIGVKNTVGIFHPGIYYVSGAGSGSFNGVGFGTGANGDLIMCSTTCVADTSGCCANGGMMVYLTGTAGVFSVGSNSSSVLKGSDPGSSYKGILFFEDRNAPAHNSPSGSHSFGGGGALTLQGTIYITNCWNVAGACTTGMTSTTYQNVRLRGGSGSGTLVQGEIIVSTLDMGGSGTITMNLNSSTTYFVDQVALVN